MFDAIVNGRIDLEGLEFDVRLADVEALNTAAFRRHADVTKLSYHAYAYCADDYVLLDAGSALGRNCGPLLISKRRDLRGAKSRRASCASRFPESTRPRISCSASRFRSAPQQDRAAVLGRSKPRCSTAGSTPALIIHENRFTYEAKGLRKIIDLGEFWESETGAPIPLGGIVVAARCRTK